MKVQTKTATFRVVLSAMVIWSIAISAYGLTSGAAERILMRRAEAELGRKWCADQSQQSDNPNVASPYSYCVSAWEVQTKQSELLWIGNPVLLLVEYIALPSIVTLAIAAYWSSILSALAVTGRNYLRWVKGG